MDADKQAAQIAQDQDDVLTVRWKALKKKRAAAKRKKKAPAKKEG